MKRIIWIYNQEEDKAEARLLLEGTSVLNGGWDIDFKYSKEGHILGGYGRDKNSFSKIYKMTEAPYSGDYNEVLYQAKITDQEVCIEDKYIIR